MKREKERVRGKRKKEEIGVDRREIEERNSKIEREKQKGRRR